MKNFPKKVLDRLGFDTFDEWPSCDVADCEYKVCLWTGTNSCFYHATELLGRKEMIRRHNLTHDYELNVSDPELHWPDNE